MTSEPHGDDVQSGQFILYGAIVINRAFHSPLAIEKGTINTAL